MKLSLVVLAGAISAVSTAYRIDLYSEYDFQGTQSTFVRKQTNLASSFDEVDFKTDDRVNNLHEVMNFSND